MTAEIEPNIDVVATQDAAAPATSFPISREGKREANILLLGVVALFVFALWSLITILDNGITGVEWISAALMLGLMLVAPLVAWTLLEEANSLLTIEPDGVRYRTIGGIDLLYPWEALSGIRGRKGRGRMARFFLGRGDGDAEAEEAEVEDDDDEPATVLVALKEGAAHPTPRSALVRLLHRQAHGDDLPVYGGLENRDLLLTTINGEIEKNLGNKLST